MTDERIDLDEAMRRIRDWGEGIDWCSHDPYDALNSPVADLVSLRSSLGRQVFTQVVKRAPVNLRPLFGIRRERNEKAIGLVAAAYARLFAAGGDESARESGLRWLRWFAGRRDQAAWGYHFPVGTRTTSIARGAPNTIATTFVGTALLDGYQLLGDERSGQLARAAAHRLIETSFDTGVWGPYFRYHAAETKLVHNASMLAAGFLTRTARSLGDSELAEAALQAARTTVARQRPDGSWPYAETEGGGWIDNFHTGYVLDALTECARLDAALQEPLRRGFGFWENSFFLEDGTPLYYPGRAGPHDAHTYATAVETWLLGAPWNPRAVTKARRTAELLVTRLLAPQGFVYSRRGRLMANHVPFVRWSTAPTFRALATLRLAERASGDEPLDYVSGTAGQRS